MFVCSKKLALPQVVNCLCVCMLEVNTHVSNTINEETEYLSHQSHC